MQGGSPSQTQAKTRAPGGAGHRALQRRGGRGEGKSRDLELLRPCSPEEGQTRGLFWFPKHMDCFVLSLKYCSLTDMALTIGNRQRRHMSVSEIKA